MHSKFIQITSVVSSKSGIVLYALDADGRIWEKLVVDQGGKWTLITQ